MQETKKQKNIRANIFREEFTDIGPKIDKWSILGVATAISGKRQEMDSAIARPTPTSLGGTANIYMPFCDPRSGDGAGYILELPLPPHYVCRSF